MLYHVGDLGSFNRGIRDVIGEVSAAYSSLDDPSDSTKVNHGAALRVRRFVIPDEKYS